MHTTTQAYKIINKNVGQANGEQLISRARLTSQAQYGRTVKHSASKTRDPEFDPMICAIFLVNVFFYKLDSVQILGVKLGRRKLPDSFRLPNEACLEDSTFSTLSNTVPL